ncbi:MAG: nuclear transport factor 2 family protein [Candidatus Eremiobacteraeota bacterium]|nr:nuclear transport factor 2 family protein [Candidatus Eremiobacteraeota bacterium]MBV8365711.1 nuclear transport factor 2 family protein [Candidatus Eremiobacteraeota bacterium]
MLTRLTFVALVALVLASASVPARADTATYDQQNVRALFTQFIGLQNQHNLAGVQKLLWNDPNLVWLTISGPVFGYDAVSAHLQKLFSGVWSATPDYTNTHVTLRSATTADVIAPMNITATVSGTPYSAKAIVVTTCTKTKDGWKVAGVIPVSAAVKNY